jgi:AraC-like DNA-binding protein/quercetin dioxygenase-like cupin family protein
MKYEDLREPGITYYGPEAVKLLRFECPKGIRCVPLHWHDRFELLIIDEGTLKANIAGEEIIARKGDVIVVNPACTHEALVLEDVSYRVVMFELIAQFSQDKTAYRLLRPYVNRVSVFLPLVRDEQLVAIVDRIFKTTKEKREGYPLMQIGLAYELLAVLFEKYQDTRYVRPVAEGRLRQVIEYIADHFCEDISSSSISEKFGYDESYFCRLFKTVIGVRPMEYIRILRLEKARRIMANEKISISKVAIECGFSDVNYFTRCFRRHYGTTAGSYRKHVNNAIRREDVQ